MAIASAAVRSTTFTSSQASVELIASATQAFKAMECGITETVALASVFGMGPPAVIGVVPTSPAALVFEDGGNTSTPASTTALAWSTSPTNPTVFSRRVSLQSLIGAGVVWTFPRGFAVLKAKTLAIQNIITATSTDIWWVIDE